MKNYKITYLIAICFAIFMSACIIPEQPAENLQEPVSENFPNCSLSSQTLKSSGVTELQNFEYDGGKLSKIYNYYNGELLSVKMFEYDENGFPSAMLSAEGSATTFKEELVFEFTEEGMPTLYAKYNTTTDELIEENEYEYNTGHLRKIITSTGSSSSEISVNTDSKGNPVSLKVTEINGQITSSDIRTEIEYGEGLNPHFNKVGYIVPELFFGQNIVSKTISYNDGVEVVTNHNIQTETNRMLLQLIKTVSGESETLSCEYNCL